MFIARVVLVVALVWLAGSSPMMLQAGNVFLPGIGGSFRVDVDSLKEARWETVVKQQYDFSCGSAAVATLLSFHYDQPTTEEEVFQAMYAVGNKQKIRKAGFSMLDMKRYLDKKGLRADGFKMTLEQFARIGVPAITLVNTRGYRHFVVIKGVEGDKVLIGDPAAGTTVVPRAQFEKIWSGAVLAAREEMQVARANFNRADDWDTWPESPVSEGIVRSALSVFTLLLPGQNELGR